MRSEIERWTHVIADRGLEIAVCPTGVRADSYLPVGAGDRVARLGACRLDLVLQAGHLGLEGEDTPDGASASKNLHYGVTIDGPDYEQLGSHFGFHGKRVEKVAELPDALRGLR